MRAALSFKSIFCNPGGTWTVSCVGNVSDSPPDATCVKSHYVGIRPAFPGTEQTCKPCGRHSVQAVKQSLSILDPPRSEQRERFIHASSRKSQKGRRLKADDAAQRDWLFLGAFTACRPWRIVDAEDLEVFQRMHQHLGSKSDHENLDAEANNNGSCKTIQQQLDEGASLQCR